MTAGVIANAQSHAKQALATEATKAGTTVQSMLEAANSHIDNLAQQATTIYNAAEAERASLRAEIATFPEKALVYVKSHLWAFAGGAAFAVAAIVAAFAVRVG